MTQLLGVTATAIRQRLQRLMALGLIQRSHEVEGRGRPSHRYVLTDQGRRSAGDNLADLAFVLWQEIQLIPDVQIRRGVISGVVRRLSERYESKVSGKTAAERMQSIAQLFSERHLPFVFDEQDGLPVIKILGCPYSDLAADGREVCEMEQELLGNMVGEPVALCRCQRDGDQCCTFHTQELIRTS
jgi:predicted ArsR family transcriptional regulator